MTKFTPRMASSLALLVLITSAISFLSLLHIRRLPALSLGDPCPAFRLMTMDGGRLTQDNLSGKETALLFVHPSCRACRSTLFKLCKVGTSHAHVLLVSLANASLTESFSRTVCSFGTWTYREDSIVPDVFRIRTLPTLILVGPDGRIGRIAVGEAIGSDNFQDLDRGNRSSQITRQGPVS